MTDGPDLDALLSAANVDLNDGPDLDDLLAGPQDPEPDPLANVNYTDDLADDAAAELTALEQAYRDRAKAETDRFKQATDSEFWFAVCFTSREQKEAFLTAAGLTRLGDKYLDGRKVARALQIST